MNTSLLNDDSTAAMDAVQLAVAARKAHEQKRIKECLGLINQLLLCDPGNAEAQALKAAVFSDVERDLSDARVLLADSESRSDGHKYRKAAEIILLKVLYLDPTHAEAKKLLATARGSAEAPQPAPVPVEAPRPKPPKLEELAFTAQPAPVTRKLEPRSSGIARKLPLLLVGVAVLVGAGFFLYRPGAAISAPAREAAVETPASLAVKPAPAGADAKVVETDSSIVVPAPADSHAVLAAVAPTIAPTQAPAPGLLAVNGSISAEIYQNGKLLGETPTTLQLPAGAQTLEYRHGDLRTVITHEIKSKETVNALVNFEVTVQINARPWAQVFIDGTARKPLGQTPLSSVKVPVGTVLAFENPNFPSKSHQVTEKDSSIQVVFP
jgi:hypothetical protein